MGTPRASGDATLSSIEPSYKRGNESDLTYSLKWASWEWLYTHAACRCIGFEVKLEGPAGRVIDVVGVGPGNVIYAVEVKSSRADLFRDDHSGRDRQRLASLAPRVHDRTALAREILQRAAPGRRGVEGTEDGTSQDLQERRALEVYEQARADYDRMTRKEEAYKERLERFSIKFRDPRFLAVAEYHYLMAPAGLLQRHEIPPQWGLLDGTPSEVVPAPRKEVKKGSGIMANVMRAIARTNARSMMRHHGVTYRQGEARFPG